MMAQDMRGAWGLAEELAPDRGPEWSTSCIMTASRPLFGVGVVA